MPGLVDIEPPELGLLGARLELEKSLRADLCRRPCLVAFSGGRDSSAVLAVAAHVARRDGLPLPVPITQVFPDREDPDEARFQQLVLAHLRLEAVPVDSRSGRDALGPQARDALRRRGPTWPAFLHDKVPLLLAARGGTLVTGEGGDDVLGTQRITPLVGTVKRRRRLDAEVRQALLYTCAPRRVRRRILVNEGWGSRGWLTPEADAAFSSLLRDDELGRPMRWAAGVRRHRASRSAVLGLGTLDALATEHQVTYSHPLLGARFVDAVAKEGGRTGWLSRTEALQRLVGDLLPPQVVRRTSKARFNSLAFGPGARQFIDGWDGQGLPEGLVNADALRAAWSVEAPSASTLLLLQHCWWQQHCAADTAA